MVFISTFYDGSVDEAAFSNGIARVSTLYGVWGAADLKVSAVAGQDRTVSVAAGICWGKGIHDVNTSAVSVALPTVSSGSRWDLIAIRRVWSTNTTSVVRVNGSSSRAIPAGRMTGYGTTDDQPLALVRVQSGSTTIQEIIDLRCWAGPGGLEAVDPLARDYLGFAGAMLKIGTSIWTYSPGANNVFSWTDIAGTSGSSANTAMRRDGSNATAVGTLLLTLAQSADSRAATRKDYVDGLGTSNASANQLVKRDSAGRAKFANPSATTDAANKTYVDTAINTTRSYALSQANSAETDAKSYAASQASSARSNAEAYARSLTANMRRAAGGERYVGAIAAGASYPNQEITFPTGRFSAPPNISITPSSSRQSIGIQSVSTTKCMFTCSNWTSASSPAGNVSWVAVQD